MKRYFRLLFILIMTAVIASESVFAQNEAGQNQPKEEPKVGRITTVAARNDFGDITIIGWERDLVEATAINTFTRKRAAVSQTENSSPDGKILLISVTENSGENGAIHLEIRAPRNVKLEPIDIPVGSVSVTNIEGLVRIKTGNGNIQISNLGAASVQTASGNIIAENVKGNFNAEADKDEINKTSSNINLKNIGGSVEIITGDAIIAAENIDGDVRLVSVHSRKINIQCVKGRVEINDTSSLIYLAGIEGDVDVTNSTGEAHFTGEVYAGKRYRMKTLTGVVSVKIPETSGFTAAVKTYQGEVKSDFNLQNDIPLPSGKNNRQFIGLYGNGQARIELDSFSGAARLRKIVSSEIKKCEP